jgi:tetratricopeptide (TPR) repeat protein
VYDTDTGQQALIFKGTADSGPVFSPDGTRIAAFHDSGVGMFDARTGQEVLTLKGSEKWLFFSPEGTQIAALGFGGRVVIWPAPKDPVAWQAERRQALADSVLTWHRQQADERARDRRWFAAAFSCTCLIQSEPDNGQHYLQRGKALAAQGKTAEARQDFEKALTLKESLSMPEQAWAHAELDHWEEASKLYARAVETPDASAKDWSLHARLRLQLGDREGYAAACSEMMKRFGTTKDGGVANSVVRACAVAPEAIADLKPAMDLARIVVQLNGSNAIGRNTLGSILYRAGQYQEAVKELNEAIKLGGTGGSDLNYVFLAMAQHRLGQTDEARKSLAQAVDAVEKNPPTEWVYRLTWQLLRREAEQLLRDKPPE